MGVDLETYRGRIGTYKFAFGRDVVTIECLVNFSKGLKAVGSVVFIGILLLIAGIESNPGPVDPEQPTSTPDQNADTCESIPNQPDGAGTAALLQSPADLVTPKTDSDLQELGEVESVTKFDEEEDILADKDLVTPKTDSGLQELDEVESVTKFDEEEDTSADKDLVTPKTDSDLQELDEVESVTKFDKEEDTLADKEEPSIQSVKVEDEETDQSEDDLDDSENTSSDIDSVLRNALECFGLTEKFPGKISIKEIVAVELFKDESGSQTMADLPWLLLRRLLSTNSETLNSIMSEITTENDDSSDDYNSDNSDSDSLSGSSDMSDDESWSPLDLFLCTYQCCDPMLKQILFKKMHLCKLAVPFMHFDINTTKLTVSVWPLRSLTIENSECVTSKSPTSSEIPVLDMNTKMVSFARFGRPKFSKSKLINTVLLNSSEGCTTFFNTDCPFGNTKRSLSLSYVEIFWLPSIGDEKIFSEAYTFLNVRGDMAHRFGNEHMKFISNISDVLVLIVDKHAMTENVQHLETFLSNFVRIALIYTDQLDSKVKKRFKSIQEKLKAIQSKVSIIYTHHKKSPLNPGEIASRTKTTISDLNADAVARTLNQRLNFRPEAIISDEENSPCKTGKQLATGIFTGMKSNAPSAKTWKSCITQVSYNYTKELGKLINKLYKTKDAHEDIQGQINACRSKQIESASITVKLFLQTLVNREHPSEVIHFMLAWLNIFIENETRSILPVLTHAKHTAQTELVSLKENVSEQVDIKSKERLVKEFENEIENASFGIEDFFRETAHLYDSFIEIDKDPVNFELPPKVEIASVVADLFLDGKSLEVIDGDSFYFPGSWVSEILRCAHEKKDKAKLMTIAGLGLQSSGKSTLLNTMFGLNFPVSTGRCTKGTHVQLIPTQVGSATSCPFEYVMVIDSEGLRAPELADALTKSNRDNEIATFVSGLGDVTMMNVMGENISDVHDILQIVIHAFLRLQIANKQLRIGTSCFLVHQNVTDTSANDKMKDGMLKLIETLDKVTEESAASEKIKHITRFKHVIRFNAESHVCYIPGLWYGNPPMTRVNRKYSEHVTKLRSNLIESILSVQQRKYSSFETIAIYINDIWKGVMGENFVFSFRNSLEIKAYIEVENEIKDQLWDLERTVLSELLKLIQNKFSKCAYESDLSTAEAHIISEIQNILIKKRNAVQESFEVIFEESEYKTIIIQWKENTLTRIKTLCNKLDADIQTDTIKAKGKRSIEIRTASVQSEHKDKLHRHSLELAKSLRNKSLSDSDIEDTFENMWVQFECDIMPSAHIAQSEVYIGDVFQEWLMMNFEHDRHLLKQLQERANVNPLKVTSLKGSFALTLIGDNDVSIAVSSYTCVNASEILLRIDVIVENFFENIHILTEAICKSSIELTYIQIKEYLHSVQLQMKDIETVQTDISFKKTFFIKLSLHVCRFALHKFEVHNNHYHETHGVKSHIAHYKEQVKSLFKSEVNERKAEESAAEQFCNAIGYCVKDIVLERVPLAVQDTLLVSLPGTKYVLIQEICEDLARQGDFDSFMKYIRTPKQYATNWMTTRGNAVLFDSGSAKYAQIASRQLKDIFNEVLNAVTQCSLFFKDKADEAVIIQEWFQTFSVNVQSCSFSEDKFHTFINLQPVKDIGCFSDSLLLYLRDVEENLHIEMKNETDATITWANENPYLKAIDKIWGCEDKCSFCGEPCAKQKDHEGSDHYSLQHRPSCCKGVRYVFTKQASTSVCNYDIQSENQKYGCSLVNYACNPGFNFPCMDKYHLYNEYKKHLPTWDIAPTSNMYDCAKYWLWFVGKFKDKLAEHYCYLVDDVPESWKDITVDLAIDSLKKVYGTKN